MPGVATEIIEATRRQCQCAARSTWAGDSLETAQKTEIEVFIALRFPPSSTLLFLRPND